VWTRTRWPDRCARSPDSPTELAADAQRKCMRERRKRAQAGMQVRAQLESAGRVRAHVKVLRPGLRAANAGAEVRGGHKLRHDAVDYDHERLEDTELLA
jgi:hypothetical protein